MRKALEELVFLGHMEEEVKMYGKVWKIRTLNAGEHLDVNNETGQYETLTRIYALKMHVLSRALVEVNGITLPDEEETLEFINKLQPVIVHKLYEEYEKIQEKQQESLGDIDEIKNS